MNEQERLENLGPAERVIQTLVTFTDHAVHNRPGLVVPDASSTIGVSWSPAFWKANDAGAKLVYDCKSNPPRCVGLLQEDFKVQGSTARYQKPGLFPESVSYIYRQVAYVWSLDNEFAAHWASWALPRDHKDMKAVLAAFMLVQDRVGAPVMDNGELLFHDDDFRGVGEAMCLSLVKDGISPKLLLRIGDILSLPQIAEINRELGFGKSEKNPPMGRYPRVVEKWLRYREENLPLLEGLVKAGYRTTVMALARRVGYKPSTEKFFEILRWKQKQAPDGRRTIAIGKEVKKAETWEGMTEKEICELIYREKPNWKRIVGLLPTSIGMTRAIVAAAIESDCMSDADLIILSPTIEDLGLTSYEPVAKKWRAALSHAQNRRAEKIAQNVKSKEVKEALQEASDKAAAKALEEATRSLRIYVVVDKSGSMQNCIEKAKEYLEKLLVGFPLDRLHVSVFNTFGSVVDIKSPRKAGIANAFKSHNAGGGTSYAAGVMALKAFKPQEGEDAIILFIGDEEDYNNRQLVEAVRNSGINPVAFGLLRIGNGRFHIVTESAQELGIPCFSIDTNMFDSDDPYATDRVLRNLIASAPVSAAAQAKRRSLVQEIWETPLLVKPVWA